MSASRKKLSRRGFVGKSCAMLGTALMAPHARTLAEAEGAETKRPEGKYFDFHVHLTQGWHNGEHKPVTVRHLLHWMDLHSIARAVVLPLVSPESFWYPVTTDYVLEQTRLNRDRLTPFCAIDPRTLATHLTDQQVVVDLLRKYRDAGALGFGEHKPMLPIDDPLSMRLYEACLEAELPVLFHLDNFANMDRPGLPGLAKVLEAFPGLTMIGHGKGWWASISGGLNQADLQIGYPRGPVSPGGAVDSLMDKHSNLYADLSSSGANAILRDKEFGEAFLLRRADRLLFGTDFYDPVQSDFPHFSLLNHFALPIEDVKKIEFGNAERVLHLT